MSFALQSIFPRLLGPVSYGNFDFLVDTTNKIVSFFENGVTVAFYTKLSRDNKDKYLVKFYSWVLILISSIYLLFIALSITSNFNVYFWPDQEVFYIVLSAILGIVTLFSNGVSKVIDACELTVKGEWIRIFQMLLSLIVFLIFFTLFKSITLSLFFIIQIFLLIALIGGSIYVLRTHSIEIYSKKALTKSQVKFYSRSFWLFTYPLIVYNLIGLGSGVGERWLLQVFSGSIQQGYFGLSSKIGAFIFLFTSAVIPLLTREFSKLFGNNKIEELKSLYLKNLKVLFFLATVLAVFATLNSNYLVVLLAGNQFKEASFVVGIMAFYPIHQTLGQLNATLYYSTNRTREYRNIGVVFLPIGLVICYLFIAPYTHLGLNLGAGGLAYEMILIQILAINVQIFNNARFFKYNYWSLLYFQAFVLALLYIIGLLEKIVINLVITNPFLNMTTHLAVLGISSLIFIALSPKMFGFEDIHNLIELVKFNKAQK